ncbi:serine protease inhibitor Kazal-type 9-like [Suricata suricatta]|uniref:serine protease inhibitor Kazal-type 9-like n=1 Tax=Suricata suricatta TaxID=37032 RepID=UPI0011560604|nr:serine protease inhibitor Kazal-type 9-like [Suricata suricatta]
MKTFFVAMLATVYFSYIFGNAQYKDILCSYYQKKTVHQKSICSIRVSPLCASNNVTYSNSCIFCFANIALKNTLKIQYGGKCRKAKKSQNMTGFSFVHQE